MRVSELRKTDFKNLFILLKSREITQSELAAAIGISPSKITDWKMGRFNPTIPLLMKTADFLNVSVDFILGRTTEEIPLELKKQLADELSEIITGAENFASEAVERYGATDRHNPMCSSLIAGINQLIETLNL